MTINMIEWYRCLVVYLPCPWAMLYLIVMEGEFACLIAHRLSVIVHLIIFDVHFISAVEVANIVWMSGLCGQDDLQAGQSKQASLTPAKRVAVADHHVLRGVEGNIGSKVGPSVRGSLLLQYITPPTNLQYS